MKTQNLNSLLFILFFAGALSACKNGKPELSNLKSLSGFSLDQTSASTASKVTPTFSISGKCSSKYTDIQVSADGGKSWVSISTVATTSAVNCSTTGTFSGELSYKSDTFDTTKWTEAGVYTGFYVRGSAKSGYSEPLTLSITNTGSKAGSFVAGGSNTPLTGSDYILKGEVMSYNTSPTMAGGNFKLQGEVIW